MFLNNNFHIMPAWIRRSIALKVLTYVGVVIFTLVVLHTYINVNHLDKKLHPVAISSLNNSLNSTANILEIVYKKTLEDAQLIGSHNALANYIDYSVLEDTAGQNDEVVNLELFLRSLTSFKTQYENIEIITNSGSLIHLQNNEIVKPSHLFDHLLGSKSNKAIKETAYFTKENNQVLFTLNYYFQVDNDFINGPGTDVFISITNNVTQELKKLSGALQADKTYLSLESNDQIICGKEFSKALPELWLKESLYLSHFDLTLSVYKEREYAFSLIHDIEDSAYRLATILILVIALCLIFTSKLVIASPLKNIIQFVNNDVLKQHNLNNRYNTKSTDEIGVFSHALNNMLDQIHDRETALKSSEERLSLALWGANEGIWEFDVSSKSLYLDAGSCKILGFGTTSASLSKEEFFASVHSDDKDKLTKYFDEFLSTDSELFEAEFRFNITENYLIWLQLKGKQNSNLGITGTIQDISDEIEAEQQIQLYATAFNSSNNAISILDPNFVTLAVNKAFTRITGYSAIEAIGTQPQFLQKDESSFNIDSIHQQIREQGFWEGEFLAKRKCDDIYVKDIDLNPVYGKDGTLTHYVAVFSDITDKKESEKELWSMANHDMLTQLPNRGYFRKTLESAIQNSNKSNDLIALLFIDLDKFKLVNDTLGHEAGDELLINVSQTLTNCVRQTDTVARLGGDEFAIILEGVSSKENAEAVIQNILTKFESGIKVQGNDTGVGASIGVSLFPKDAKSVDSLIHCADTAMYSAKTTGNNLCHFYHSTMGDHVNRRNLLEQELKIALKQDNLTLHYQPQIDLKTGKIISFEALSRWNHETLGFIPPDEFIPIAEDTGLIAELGINVFNKACKQLKAWHNDGYTDIRVAINISPKQFLLTDIHMIIANALEYYQVDAKYLELELTESLIVEDPEKIIKTLNLLKSIGIRLSIDDFGTGYSSLSYLSKFPLDILKIDKSFVQQTQHDRRSLSLTKAIIGIAESLQLDVIAEGVETKEQLDILKSLGCTYIQGYYFSPAVSSQNAQLLLEQEANVYSVA